MAGIIYLLYLVFLILKAYSELRAMPYFGKKDEYCIKVVLLNILVVS